MVESTGQEVAIPDCVINDEVRQYEPSLDDIFVILENGEYQRLIFSGQELREREDTHIKDFRNFV